MMNEIDRVLRKPSETIPRGGAYFCITLAQNFILRKLVKEFHEDWDISVMQVASQDQTSSLIPFCFTFRNAAAKKTGQISRVSSSCATISGEITFDQLEQMIGEIQWMNAARVEFSSFHRGNRMVLDLHGLDQDENGLPRFTIYLIDHPEKKAPNGRCCVFIVPQGREHEWLFSSPEGQMELVTVHIGFQRVLLVHLGRTEFVNGLQGVQDELSGKVG